MISSLSPTQRGTGVALTETGGKKGVWVVYASLGIKVKMKRAHLLIEQTVVDFLVSIRLWVLP